MATEITETEVVTGTLRRVKLGDSTFKVPATPTIRYMFWMRGFLKRFQDGELNDDDIVECYDQTVAFLKRYNDRVDEEKLQDAELSELISFYSRAFGAVEEEPDDERPPRSNRSGGATKSGRSRSAARSRS